VASTHDEAWRSAYQGHHSRRRTRKADQNRRGPQWWDRRDPPKGRPASSVLVFGDQRSPATPNYGRNRARSLHFEGEIYELYSASGIPGASASAAAPVHLPPRPRSVAEAGLKRHGDLGALPTTIRRRNSIAAPRRPHGWRARRRSFGPQIARQGGFRPGPIESLWLCCHWPGLTRQSIIS